MNRQCLPRPRSSASEHGLDQEGFWLNAKNEERRAEVQAFSKNEV